jgi:enterochelin esterase-like enzyme
VSGDQVLAIDQLRSTLATLSDQQQREAAAATFFEEHALPVVEGHLCTFATRAAADSLYLRHRVKLWQDDLELEQIPGTDVWFLTIELEWGSRVEYQFEIFRDGQRWRFNDPYNPRLARLVDLQVHSAAQGRHNRITMYLPARFETSMPYPLLVVHDGGDYLDYASMKLVLDNLIHDKKLAKIIVAFSYPGERLTEYPDDPDHGQWITRELVPRLEREFPLLAAPSGRCLMGTSFGAVAALSTAVRFADVYGSLLLQSGSFLYSDRAVWHGEGATVFDPVVRFIDRYRSAPVRAVDRAFISCGAYEDLADANRAMLPIFRSTGMKINYVESRDGHSWESWRDQLGPGLCWLFPGDGGE